MLSKTMIAAATALSIGLGAVGASTTPAAAANVHVNGYVAGPGFAIGFGDRRPGGHWRGNRGQCHPVFKNRWVFVPYRGWTMAKVQVGQRCDKRGHRPHRRWH